MIGSASPPPMSSTCEYVVAIAGATGKIGSLISNVFLSPHYRPFYSEIRLLVRNPDCPAARELARLGATLVKVDMLDQKALNEALKDVNAVVNALGSYDHEAKTKLLDGVLASNAIVYIPSEYGIDHRFNEFEHILWTDKKHHITRARADSGGRLKVIAIYIGLVLETAFRPAYGADKEGKRFSIIGSKDTRITYTATEDIAWSVAQITTMALGLPSSITDDIRVAGTTVSWEDMRVMLQKSGEDVEIISVDEPESFRKKTIENEGTTGSAPEYIRLLLSEGKNDFSADNQNEWINPGETLWKWTTMEDYIYSRDQKPFLLDASPEGNQ